ncbi:hypothetical protein [Gordonia sp. NPDC003585]|uniref:hypothetical protein n=1 Tax=Gordonia sp. NPDC003585 TaxID=3154275 RepID=UPI0033B29374
MAPDSIMRQDFAQTASKPTTRQLRRRSWKREERGLVAETALVATNLRCGHKPLVRLGFLTRHAVSDIVLAVAIAATVTETSLVVNDPSRCFRRVRLKGE